MFRGWKPSTSFSGSMANELPLHQYVLVMATGPKSHAKLDPDCIWQSGLTIPLEVMVSGTRTTSLRKPAARADLSFVSNVDLAGWIIPNQNHYQNQVLDLSLPFNLAVFFSQLSL